MTSPTYSGSASDVGQPATQFNLRHQYQPPVVLVADSAKPRSQRHDVTRAPASLPPTLLHGRIGYSAPHISHSHPTLQRHYEVADGDDDVGLTPEVASQEQKFTCDRCLRDFEAHERHKFEQHVKKCQD